jgi:hypothetical protein
LQKETNSIILKLGLAFFPLTLFIFLPYDFQQKVHLDTILLISIGSISLYLSLKKLSDVNTASSWTKTRGKLLYQKVKCDNPHAQKMVRSYYPYLKYSYEVRGKTYTSDKVAFYRELHDTEYETIKYIKTISQPFLNVYFNPRQHNASVIAPNLPLHRKIFWYFFVLLGVSSIFIGLYILF